MFVDVQANDKQKVTFAMYLQSKIRSFPSLFYTVSPETVTAEFYKKSTYFRKKG